MLKLIGASLMTLGLILLFGCFVTQNEIGAVFSLVTGPVLINYGYQLIK